MRPIKMAFDASVGSVSANEGKLECDKAESPEAVISWALKVGALRGRFFAAA